MTGQVHIRIDGNSTGAEAATKRVEHGFRRVGAAARAAAAEAARVPQGGGMTVRQRFAGVATGLSRMGGRVGGMAGMAAASLTASSGAVAGLGVAAMAAGVALNAFMAHAHRASEQAAEVVRTWQQTQDAVRSAREGADRSAMGEVRGLRALRGLGGQQAVDLARVLSRDGEAGAVGGLTALARSRQGISGDAIAAARAASATGQVDFGEAAQAIAKGIAVSADANATAARILAHVTGRRTTAGDVAMMQGQLAGGPEGSRLRSIQLGEGNVAAALIQRVFEGGLAGSLNMQARAIRSPEAAALDGIRVELQKTVEQMRAAVEAETAAAGVMREMGYLLGLGEGSRARQLWTFVDQQRAAGVIP